MNGDDVPDDGDDLLDVYQAPPEHVLGKKQGKTDFKAWHHPRKQYVRVEQWCAEVRRLLGELKLPAGESFKYLTLPGNEMLDVRALHGVCERAGIRLKYLGFNSVGPRTAEAAELALSQDEVRSLSHVDEFSTVLEYTLEAIANPKSPARATTMSQGPFHAINLDLCDSITLREVGHSKGSPLEAAGELLKLQVQSSKPWLLFITTKTQPGLVSDFARDGFMQAIGANSAASEEFKKKLIALLASKVEELDSDLETAWVTQDVRFLKLFTAGLGKWLLRILGTAAPPRGLSLLSSCYYQSGPAGPDMLSLAFRCDGIAQTLHDPSEILTLASPSLPPKTEIESALMLADATEALFDLDVTMRDAEVSGRMIDTASRLMADARFAEADYRKWANRQLAGR